MLDTILELTQFSAQTFALVVVASFFAGLIRGFAGFGLSAVMFAGIVTLVPPIELIPITYFLEAAAGIAMLRNGVKNADMSIVWGLVIFSAIGTPIGLYLTTSIDRDVSKLVALILVLGLTLLQLAQIKSRFLATKPGLFSTGLMAGIVSGLASIGGMVVALYVLSRDTAAKEMRASLVMFLFGSMFLSIVYLLLYEVMNVLAVWRAAFLILPMFAGLFLGSILFRPSLARFYSKFCLLLLVTLSLVGLFQQLS